MKLKQLEAVEARRDFLEEKDNLAAQQAEIKFLEVTCMWCAVCKKHYLSGDSRKLCEAAGHATVIRKVKRSRIECCQCSMSIYILDNAYPDKCNRCKSNVFRKVNYYKQKEVAFAKDKFMARGVDHSNYDNWDAEQQQKKNDNSDFFY